MAFTSGKRNRCIMFVAALLTVILLLSGCVDLFSGRRPYDYPNSVWACEQPYIKITVDSEKRIYTYCDAGNGQTMICFAFDFGRGIIAYASDTPNEILFKGKCSFGSKSFRIEVVKDDLWGGEYDTLKFVRLK